MAPSNPKIEELRFRLKADPKNRIFYPLAEELRKVAQLTEAEQVLRTGLTHHPTYLSAWVSLGRVLRDQGNNNEAVEALNKALVLDPGNVVAARLLADAYLSLGEKVEAIKKYKLVHALLPSDDQLLEVIARLDQELNAPPPAPVVAEPEPAPDPEPPPEPELEVQPEPEPQPEPEVQPEPEPEPEPQQVFAAPETSPFAQSEPESEPIPFVMASEEPAEEPAEEPGEESPFANDDAAILAAAEETFGMERRTAPAAVAEEPPPADEAMPWGDEPAADEPATANASAAEETAAELAADEPAADVFAAVAEQTAPVAQFEEPVAEPVVEEPAAEEPPAFESPFAEEEPVAAAPDEDLTETVTMADLYARQGMTAKAIEIYEHILQRDPHNEAVRAKHDALGPSSAPADIPPEAPEPPLEPVSRLRNPKAVRLESWLAKVGRKEDRRV
jgi:tetratricopeptide (TPR) repeat protein